MAGGSVIQHGDIKVDITGGSGALPPVQNRLSHSLTMFSLQPFTMREPSLIPLRAGCNPASLMTLRDSKGTPSLDGDRQVDWLR
jgi:hypothetical protein